MPRFVDVSDTVVARTVLDAGKRIWVNASESASLQDAVTEAQTDEKSVYIPAGTYTITSEVATPNLINVAGDGPGSVVISQTSDDVNGVRVDGNVQYLTIGGFAVEHSNQQDRNNSATAALYLDGGIQFSEVGNLLLSGGFYGLRATGGSGNNVEFNNTFSNIRVKNWWKAAYSFESVGSGSVHTNLYCSSISTGSVWRAVQCWDFSGEFHRLNIERSTIRDCVIDLASGHDVSFHGLHTEELSMISKGTTPLDGAMNAAVIRTTGKGIQKIDQWTIDTCHFGPYIVDIDGMTASGTTARAVLKLMNFQQKTASGHGIEVGDTIYVEGADTATSSAYNGAKTVTAVGADWVEFTITGSPASPADVNSGSDCITVSLGGSLINAICLVYASGDAGKIHIGNMHIRDTRVVGASASRRQNLLRLFKADTQSRAELQIDNISFAGQRSNHSHWLEPRIITGYSRTSNVSTFYFDQPHNLRSDTALHVYSAGDATFNGVYTSLTPVSRYAVSVSNTGSDLSLTRDTATRAIMRTFQISSVSRAANYATITTTSDHGLYSATTADGVGLRVAIRADDTDYNGSDVLILSVPSTTTFVVRNVGSDSGTTSDTGSVMLIEGGLSVGALTEVSGMSGPVSIGELDEYCCVLNPGPIAAGSTANATNNVQRADAGQDVVELIGIDNRDGRLNYYGEVSGTNQVQIKVTNPTAGSITPAAMVVRYRIVRS